MNYRGHIRVLLALLYQKREREVIRVVREEKSSINVWHKNRKDMFRDWRGDPRGENTIAFSLIVPTVLIGRER